VPAPYETELARALQGIPELLLEAAIPSNLVKVARRATRMSGSEYLIALYDPQRIGHAVAFTNDAV
jgi:hypothetical protein